MSNTPNEGGADPVDTDDGMVDLGADIGSQGVEDTDIQTRDDVARIHLRDQGITNPTPQQIEAAIREAFPDPEEQA